jgi:hypothetical protein
MPYLNLDLAYFNHRKTVRLVGLLGRGAEVLPIKLWSYCGMHHAESGRLTSYGPEEIETAAGWWGEKGRAVEAMVTVGFLDKDDSGNFQVHDWLDHAGHLVAFKKRAISAAKRRWKKYATSNAKRISKQCSSRGKAQPSLDNQLLVIEDGGVGGDLRRHWPSPYKLIELYNLLTPDECPSVNTVSPSRLEKAREYLSMFPEEQFWREVFRQFHRSKFLRGLVKNNGHKNFVADFDWLLTKGKDRTENVAKVHDGKYADEK